MDRREIKFQGSELQICINNHNKKDPDGLDKLTRHYKQAKIAMEEKPDSIFWKDAVIYLEQKLGIKKE